MNAEEEEWAAPARRRVRFSHCEVVGEGSAPSGVTRRDVARLFLFRLLHSQGCEWHNIVTRGRRPHPDQCTCGAAALVTESPEGARKLLTHFFSCTRETCWLCDPVQQAWTNQDPEVLLSCRFKLGQKWNP